MKILNDLDANSNKVLSVATPTSDTDAVNKLYVDTEVANIDSIKEINGNTDLQFWKGTKAQYNALGTKSDSVVYVKTDEDLLQSLGITSSVEELNFMDGVTSNVQTQLNAKSDGEHTHTASDIGGANDSTGILTMHNSILPSTTSSIDIGSSTQRFKTIWVDEARLAGSTLYLGDTPVLGTESEVITVKASAGQTINVKTTGMGYTTLSSEAGIDATVTGSAADIKLTANGTAGNIKLTATNNIEMLASNIQVTGNTSVEDITVTGNISSTGNAVTIKDNIVEINSGELGSGVTAGTAGLRINRGEVSDYLLVFDESDDNLKAGMMGSLHNVATQDWVTTNVGSMSVESAHTLDGNHAKDLKAYSIAMAIALG